jgi:hypothetical protein
MNRAWFQDADGTYYRNCPLIAVEWDEAIEAGDMAAVYRLRLEWGRAWHNTIKKTELEEGDLVVKSKDDPIIEPYLRHYGAD